MIVMMGHNQPDVYHNVVVIQSIMKYKSVKKENNSPILLGSSWQRILQSAALSPSAVPQSCTTLLLFRASAAKDLWL